MARDSSERKAYLDDGVDVAGVVDIGQSSGFLFHHNGFWSK